MVDTQSAINFVYNHGSEIEKARVDSITNGKEPNENVISQLSNLQNKDGGFPYKKIKGSLSTINNTLFMLQWLDDLNMLSHSISRKIIQYLIQKEKNDGTWQEDEEILEYGPPEWMDPRKRFSNIYTTTYSLFWLLKGNFVPTSKYAFYTELFEQYIEFNGSFEGFLQNSWLGTSCLGMMNTWDSEKVTRPLEYVASIQDDQLPANDLVWLTLSLLQAGFPSNNRLTSRLSYNLFEKQSKSGSFETEGNLFAVETTIQALKVAKILKEI
ncbi:MAG: hypothetical protein ACW967_10230 [Candidatus Hodarchaeales archaeon]|jgi:hypothetical protein